MFRVNENINFFFNIFFYYFRRGRFRRAGVTQVPRVREQPELAGRTRARAPAKYYGNRGYRFPRGSRFLSSISRARARKTTRVRVRVYPKNRVTI